MKLSLQTDFALRTLIYAAFKQERIRISEIAQFFDISKAHIAKVVNLLRRHGYIRSIRGLGGGLELAKPADQISVGEIVRCVEGTTHLLECMSIRNVCAIQHFCNLKISCLRRNGFNGTTCYQKVLLMWFLGKLI